MHVTSEASACVRFARAYITLAVLLAGITGCGDSHAPMGDDTVTFGADGRSEDFVFDVPEGARSVTILVEGQPDAMLALGSLRLSDDLEHITPLDTATLRERYGSISGSDADAQFPRPGTFVFQYPTLASQALPPGEARLRVLSDGTAPARVRIFTPTTGGTVLHVSLVSFSPALPLDVEPPMMERVRAIYASIGVSVVVDERVTGATHVPLTFDGSPATPGDEGSALVGAARALLVGDAFPVIFVEHADDFVLGSSRGLPCPPVVESDARAILVDATVDSMGGDDQVLMARVVAHELGHALGLRHVDGANSDAVPWTDPFDDTVDFDDTIMGSALLGGTIPDRSFRISSQQAFALTRSALLD